MAATSLDSIDLEAMRKDESSWHPCRISLSSSDHNVGITVDFGTDDEDDVIIYSKEDALSRLRFRSIPLQGDECTSIIEGECILALLKTQSRSLFIDAIIVEPKRVKHSKRVHCRCTFKIKWLNSELKGETAVVQSKAILKLSEKNINDHPVFSKFLNALNSENLGETTSVLSFSEESTCEPEFIGILEKQVEEISKLVDGSKADYMDLFIEVKSDNAVNQKSKAKQCAPQRITRSRNKNQFEINAKTEAEAKWEAEVKPVLTPLAARAALASLVHELPENSLCFSAGEPDFLRHKPSQQSDATGLTEQSAIEATSNSLKSTSHLHNSALSLDQNHSIKVKAKGKQVSHDSSELSATREKHMEPSRELYGSGEDEHVVLRNSISFSGTRRLTRSMQKGLETASPDLKQLGNIMKPVRSAHSVAFEEALASNDVDKELTSSTKQRKKHRISPESNEPAEDVGNSAKELVTMDKNEIKKKLAPAHADSASETDSTARRNEPSTRRTRASCEDDSGDAVKKERISEGKKSDVSLHKDSAKLKIGSLPRTRSQARS